MDAGADDGCIYAWDLKTEKMVWKHKTDGMVRSSPAIARGKLFIGSDDGFIYCFGNQQIRVLGTELQVKGKPGTVNWKPNVQEFAD